MKILKDEKVQEGEIVETRWDLRKLAIGVVILILLFIAGAYIFLPNNQSASQNDSGVLGISSNSSSSKKDIPPLPSKDDIQNIITNAQSSLSQITADNLTSSQAAIQQIITNLQEIQSSKSATNVFCDLVCKDK